MRHTLKVIDNRVFERERNVKNCKTNSGFYIVRLKYLNSIKKYIKKFACFKYSLYLCIVIKK